MVGERITAITRNLRTAAPVLAAIALLAVPTLAQASYPKAKNGRIAFTARQVENGDVFLMNADGSGRVALTTDTVSDFDPVFSPNGKLIAFSRDTDPNPDDPVSNFEILVMKPSGAIQANLTQSAEGEFAPAFSPDGKRIAFVRDTAPGSAQIGDIFIAKADGSGAVNLTNTPTVNDFSPDFSPDGKRIVFTSGNNPTVNIHLMNTDGSGRIQLTSGSGFDDSSPSFSPDGKRIAFARDTDPAPGGFAYKVFVMNADGSGAASISGSSSDDSPAYSPDGKQIALRRQVAFGPNEFDIFTVGADGSSPLNLTSGLSQENEPSWEYVYKCAGRRATIVGDDGKDKIKGTKKADVIVGNGGKDKIRGRGGNDRICGGKGKDKLIGGKGKDTETP